MGNLKLLKKLKGRKIHEIRAEGGDMSYESGRLFCLEGKTQWYIYGEKDKDPLHLIFWFKCEELGVDDTHDLIVEKFPLDHNLIEYYGFHLRFEKDYAVKHLSLFHFHEEGVGKVYENNILLKFENETSLLVHPDGFVPFLYLHSEETEIKRILEGGIEAKVF